MASLRSLLLAALVGSLLAPAMATAKQSDGKRVPKVIVYPNYPKAKKHGRYGFLPGYRQPAPLTDWRERSPRYGGGDFDYGPRFWSGGDWRYGWGYPQFYRGRWNGGTFGPCWTQTPIGAIWNCGR
jgi:hypothetical protein